MLVLTDLQESVLTELSYFYDEPESSSRANGFCVPMDVGGSDASYHSRVLRQLVNKGLVDVLNERHAAKAYRINKIGLAAVAAIS